MAVNSMTMIANAILLTGILGTFTSCSDQSRALAEGKLVSEMSQRIWTIYQAKDKSYWFGSDGQGVFRYDGKTIIQFSTKHGLPNDRVREIQEDKSGNIYIGTLQGISKFDGQKFTTLTPIKVKSATQGWRLDPDDLWFKGGSTESGPYRYDGKSLYQLRFPKHPLEDEMYSANPSSPSSLYGVYTIYKDKAGSLWFGTAGLGLYRYDGKSISWLYEDHLTNTPEGGSFGIRSIIEDRNGKFWFCNNSYRYTILPTVTETEKGAINYKREKGVKPLKNDGRADPIYFQFIVKDNKQDLWMSTYRGGVWRFSGDGLTHYPVTDGSENINVISIARDNGGGLWLGTEESGPYKFNGKSFVKFRP
jgi:ligand-binding sensor domain-containing protein